MSSRPHTVLPWAVRRTRLPLLALRCVACPSGRATIDNGRFRVNANGKLLDVWLLVNCVFCGRTGKLTVHDRVPVRSLPADLLAGYSANSPSLVVDTLLDPLIARRNRFALDWDGCWELHAPPVPEDPWLLQTTVTFDDPVPDPAEPQDETGFLLRPGVVAPVSPSIGARLGRGRTRLCRFCPGQVDANPVGVLGDLGGTAGTGGDRHQAGVKTPAGSTAEPGSGSADHREGLCGWPSRR
ncbi:DUF1062 domain-containing protein [Actinomadura chokoriensis]